ncbi:MAG: methyltransferase domain-containing protein [Endozoicomonas sp.]
MTILSFFLGVLLTWLVMSGLLSQGLALLVRIWLPSSRREQEVMSDQWLLNSGLITSSGWRLLGYWKETASYPQACAEMAGLLADKACLSSQDRVLDVGFASYDQLLVWLDYYQVQSLTAVTGSEQLLAGAQDNCSHFSQLTLERGSEHVITRLNDEPFDKLLVLDCAYHFDDKSAFFRDARRVLKPGGSLALTDMVLARPYRDRREQRLVRALARSCGIRVEGLLVQQIYESTLQKAGFKDVDVVDISEDVLSGFCFWFAQHHRQLSSLTRSRVWIRLRLLEWFIRWMQHRGLLAYLLISAR